MSITGIRLSANNTPVLVDREYCKGRLSLSLDVVYRPFTINHFNQYHHSNTPSILLVPSSGLSITGFLHKKLQTGGQLKVIRWLDV